MVVNGEREWKHPHRKKWGREEHGKSLLWNFKCVGANVYNHLKYIICGRGWRFVYIAREKYNMGDDLQNDGDLMKNRDF